MYIKFKDNFGRMEVRDVRHFEIRSMDVEEEDKSTIHGAELVDGSFEVSGDFLDSMVEYACGIMLGGSDAVDAVRFRKKNAPVSVAKDYSEYCPDISALAWFDSWTTAEKVLDDICNALSAGEQFFDLIGYGEDGRRKNAKG